MDILVRLTALVMLVYQFGDYVVKAMTSYSETAQGAKEWHDVELQLAALGMMPPDVVPPVGDIPTPQPNPTPPVPEAIARFIREHPNDENGDLSGGQSQNDARASVRIVHDKSGGQG